MVSGRQISVSVCIPAFNNLALFERALESVLMQDMDDYEIVVTDDSQYSAIGDYLEKRSLPQVVYHRNATPLGAAANWNRAIRIARAGLIKFLHHDDYFSRADSLRHYVSAITESPDIALAFSFSTVYFKRQNVFHLQRPTSRQLKRLAAQPEFLFFRNVIGNPSSVIFRKSDTSYFDQSLRWLVDVELYMRLLRSGRAAVIKESLVTAVDGEQGQITQQVSADAQLVVREHLSLWEQIYKPPLNNHKSSLYFQELFDRFGIKSWDDLSEKAVSASTRPFFDRVFTELPKRRLLKRVVRRLLTSRYNKRIFQIERF